MRDAYLVDYARSDALLAAVIDALLERGDLDAAAVEDLSVWPRNT